MKEKTASEQIDDIIKLYGGWKGATIEQLRSVILASYPDIQEEIKWRMRTRPEGLPVWSMNGIVCYIETWKDNIKLMFAKGAFLEDNDGLFNARLDSSSVRAIELRENDHINTVGITALISNAIEHNRNK